MGAPGHIRVPEEARKWHLDAGRSEAVSGGSWEGCGAGRSKEVGALAGILCCGPGCGAAVLGCSCSLWSCGAGECKAQAVGARRLVSGPYPRGAAAKAGVAGVQKLLTGTPRLYS